MSNPIQSFFSSLFGAVVGQRNPQENESPEPVSMPHVQPMPSHEPIPPTLPSDPETDDPELLAAIRASLEEQSVQVKRENMEELVLALSDWTFLAEVLAELPGVNPSDRRFDRYR